MKTKLNNVKKFVVKHQLAIAIVTTAATTALIVNETRLAKRGEEMPELTAEEIAELPVITLTEE